MLDLTAQFMWTEWNWYIIVQEMRKVEKENFFPVL